MTSSYRIERLPVQSELLKGNRGGDPWKRELVLLVPGEVAANHPLPVIWMLPAHGNSSGSFLSHDPWREGLPQRLARLTDSGEMQPVLVALPDLFTRYGGSQGLDSAATGAYESHLWDELRPLLENHRPITTHGVCGHSSGGYAALVQAMKHPDLVSACACHSGDMLFEFSYQADFPKAASRIRAEGGVEQFMKSFDDAHKKFDGRWMSGLNAIAMSACYSPDENEPLGIALPFDLETCELRHDVWERWLRHDPVRMIESTEHEEALRKLRLLYIDAGNRDEWNLQWGARALVRRLAARGIRHQHEEFDDGHSGVAYRLDRSLPLLVRALHGDG